MENFQTKNVGGFNITYRLNSPDEYVILDTFDNLLFLKGFPEYKIKPTDVIMDIGAHIGTYSLQASSMAAEGKVFAFEPCQETFLLLEKNVKNNHRSNVSVHKIALTDYIGKAKLY